MADKQQAENKPIINDFNPDNADASDNQLSFDEQTGTLTEKKISDIEWDEVDQDKPFSNGENDYAKRLQDEEIQNIIFNRDLKSFFKKLTIGIAIAIILIYVGDSFLIFFGKEPVSDKLTTILQYTLTTSIGFLIGNGTKKE